MSEERIQKTFTFEVGKDFSPVFEQFKKIAGKGERSAAAMIRFLIKEYVEKSILP